MRPSDYCMNLVGRFGLHAFPLAERSKVPCIEGGRNSNTDDVDALGGFFAKRPNCNYGVATGSDAGGLFVIDLDVDDNKGEDGVASMRAWEATNGELPECPTVTTPRGGMHLYFYSNEPVKCSTNPDLGIDVRGDGGYVVGPGSVLDNGEYEWDIDIEDCAIPVADSHVMSFVRHVQGGKRSGQPFKLPSVIKQGERNPTLFRYACSLRAYSADEVLIMASVEAANTKLCRPPLPADEVDKIVASALSYEEGKSSQVEQRGNVSKMLARNGKGAPLATIDNCMVILNNDTRLAGHFAYDEFAYQKIVNGPVPWDSREGVRPFSNVDHTQLTAFIERFYYMTRCKSSVIDAVSNVCANNRRNPVAEWIRSLKWDRQDRIAHILDYFLGIKPSAYSTEAVKLFMRGAIARALTPGAKFDTALVLVGAQGIGKSSFLRMLAHNPRWFNDNLNTISGDEAVEKLRGMWIVEMAELLATKQAKEVEAIKAFLTVRMDTLRPKYERETEQRPRTCVFAGTTNDWNFLTDPTGNRRFLPIVCTAKKSREELFDDSYQDEFDQMWAQVWHEWQDGNQSLTLPPELLDTADKMRAEHMEDDPRIGLIQDYLDRVKHTPDVRVCVAEILKNVLNVPDAENPSRKLVNEIHKIMRNSITGWKRYDGNPNGKARTNYGVQICYVPDGGES